MAVGLLIFMPDSWHDRMDTIKTYEQDGSAMGRINAWTMAFNLASDRWIGGGFRVDTHAEFEKYAPDPTNPLAAHSIYFQVLGEHGFFGLFLFLAIWGLTWLAASDIRKRAPALEDCAWMVPLAGMIQVSLVGYLVGGAFLSLAYFDVAFNMAVIIVLARELLRARLKEEAAKGASDIAGRFTYGGDDWAMQRRAQ
ncbi:MAG: putative O-glycosylation ligase, exosortase A system-associated [Betaproteobacteria bacterium]|nr:putative O-glycosylation ligase, exosortase A system-associated [Betaproteobacteria bacterium]